MKIVALLVVAALALAAMPQRASAAAITAGDLVVTQFGDGAAGLTGAATAVFVKEFTTLGGAPVQTIAMPTAAGAGTVPNPMTNSGSSTEGIITLSTDGQYLTLAGYAAAPGLATPQSSTAAAVPRVITRITVVTGDLDTTSAMNNVFSTSNIRSAVSTNGTDIWTGGSASGAVYSTLGSASGTRVNTSGNSGTTRRIVNIFNNQLYVSGASTGGPNLSVNTVGSGLPTVGSAETNITGLPTTGTHSVYDYWFKDSNTLYLADDSNAANGGGIQKWTQSAGTWSMQYILLNNQTNNAFPGDGTTAIGTRGLAGYVDGGGNAVLFATTNESTTRLITVTDTGAAAALTALASAPANTAFRGVEFIPAPEPSSLCLVGLAGLLALRRGNRKLI